jgi:hypothetical protein
MKKSNLSPKFLEELRLVPIVSLACEKTGISRNSVYRWRKEDPEFTREMDEVLAIGVDSVNDLAESKLINNIQKGEMQAIKYWLDNNKKNYARPRPPMFWDRYHPRTEENRIVLIDMGRESNQKDNQ